MLRGLAFSISPSQVGDHLGIAPIRNANPSPPTAPAVCARLPRTPQLAIWEVYSAL
jgi:hypothetical protein